MRERFEIRRHLGWFLLAILAGASCGPDHACAASASSDTAPLTIEYISHACFRVTSPAGKQLLIDPFASRVWLGYDFPSGIHADAVLISHPHYDHDGGEAMGRQVPWPPETLVLRRPGTNHIGDITVIGYAGKHADPWGKEFGQSNTVWLVEIGGLRIVHLGDNGPLGSGIISQLGRVDVLMIPIDSQFHILKAEEIHVIRNQLTPSILIPMHYRHDDLELIEGKPSQLGSIHGWARSEPNARYLPGNKQQFSLAGLSKKPEVLIFNHSPLVRAPSKVQEQDQPHSAAGGATDLIGPAMAFRQGHQRWPRDYTELAGFIEQSLGKSQARRHDRVELTVLADGSLEIYSIDHGQTNRIGLPIQEIQK
jgi:L-ascorbate metabolism protein UlaG (beta-lactamase superfamily)